MVNGYFPGETPGMKSLSRGFRSCSGFSELCIRLFVLVQCFLPVSVSAQAYDSYGYGGSAEDELSFIERLVSSSFMSLLMVFVGAGGIFLYATAAGKGERSERQRGMGIVLILVGIVIIYYRFTIRNE